MKTMEQIVESKIIDELFLEISKHLFPIERSVIVEKYKKPICDINERISFTFNYSNDIDDYYHESCLFWLNSNGNLHSFNDNPSKIVWNTRCISLEWHNDGKIFRKNSKYNSIKISKKQFYDFSVNKYINKGTNVQFELYNEKRQLHSFNDMPAIINEKGVHWYWNGKNSRNYHYTYELPCNIDEFGNVTFQKNNEHFSQSVKFPISRIHYSDSVLLNLRNYEKYVKWPIRDLFTL